MSTLPKPNPVYERLTRFAQYKQEECHRDFARMREELETLSSMIDRCGGRIPSDALEMLPAIQSQAETLARAIAEHATSLNIYVAVRQVRDSKK